MKRLLALLLSVVLLAACTACAKTSRIELPFSPEDVTTIELYRFFVPTSAEQKTITAQEDIQAVWKILTNCAVKKNTLEPVSGGTVTSFRFLLKDGTKVEIIYTNSGGKEGAIVSSYLFDYQTSADIGSIWKNYGENHKNVGEENLPTYES